jgi:hypothetical protein
MWVCRRGFVIIEFMKTLFRGLSLFVLILSGCGTPDPLLYTNDSKGRSATKSDQQEQSNVAEESDSRQWQRTGTHEVDQK